MIPSVTNPPVVRCENCGAEISQDADRCPECGQLTSSPSSKIALAVTLLLLMAGAAFTQYFVKLHRQTEYDMARRWFARGGEAMQAGMPNTAAEDYRTALSYDRENNEYRLRLAEALLGGNQLNEAAAHLGSLWEDEPANGEVNLDLARVYVRKQKMKDAVRYYRNAINGVWPEHPIKNRIAVRFELSRYLMQQQDHAEAQAEVMALLADPPPDPADKVQLGQLLLEVHEPEHAADVFSGILAKEHNNAAAWLGKAEALLALGDYASAERSYESALEHDPKSTEARQQLAFVKELLRVAPGLRGLSLAERAHRVADAFTVAWQRLADCAAQNGLTLAPAIATGVDSANPLASGDVGAIPQAAPTNDLQSLYASGLEKQPLATEKNLLRNPDALEPTMLYVFQVERATAPVCPVMDVTNRVLLTLAQREAQAQ